MIQDMPCRK